MIVNAMVWKEELKTELGHFNELLLNGEYVNGLLLDGREFEEEVDFEEEIDHAYLEYKVQKFFFVSSFIVRKLIESDQLSEELNRINIPIIEYKSFNEDARMWWRGNRVENFYNLENGRETSISIKKLCDIFIHSFVFTLLFIEEKEKPKFDGILVNSDQSRRSKVFFVKWKNFSKLLEEVINDYFSNSIFDNRTGRKKNFRTVEHAMDAT